MSTSRLRKWLKRTVYLLGFIVLGILFLLNLMAYNHAHSMLHFAPPETPLPGFREMAKTDILKIILFGFNIPKPTPEALPEEFDLQYETVRIPGNEGIELEAWHVPVQDATHIAILFHGYANEKSSLLREAAAFRKMGISSLLVDFRGSGGSNRLDTTIGYDEAEDVRSAFDFAEQEMPETKILFYGQSMGSATILRALATETGGTAPTLIILESVFDRLFSTVGNRFESMGVPTFPLAHLFIFWGGYHGGFPGFEHNPVEYACEVDSPALLLHGTEDNRATFEQAKTVFECLKGPKQLEPFEGHGHGSLITDDPEHWERTVSGFIHTHLDLSSIVEPSP